MTKFETFACNQIFHSYPEDFSFVKILQFCLDDKAREAFNDSLEDTENDDQCFIVCEQYENEPWEQIFALLKDYKYSAQNHFGE